MLSPFEGLLKDYSSSCAWRTRGKRLVHLWPQWPKNAVVLFRKIEIGGKI